MDPEIKIRRHIPKAYLNQLELVEYLIGIVDEKNTSRVIKKIREVNELVPV